MFLPASLVGVHAHTCWSGINHIVSLPLYSESDWQIPFWSHLWLTLKMRFILCRSAVVFKQWRSAYAFLQNDLCYYNLLWFSPLFFAPVWLTRTPWLFWLNWNSADFPGTAFTSLLTMFHATASTAWRQLLCKSCPSVLLPSFTFNNKS